ncbi:flavin reductase family protein [Marinobacterium arenosum]|uniref:flavin reductase family protein n=1 Tax=Marinobacterium arenosum TaxID=2862496 RepID=UPI002104011F|nr:flavin reductase family protein [Marinobacterium arenosum]
MIQTIVPRPVAWVLSEHGNGEYNLAPFSYFAPVCSDPPMVMISLGHKPDGSLKDTYRNILERQHFVIHLAHRELAEAVTRSARVLPEGESELALIGMETVPFEGSPLPRLAAARVALSCRLHEVKEVGNGPQYLVFGLVERIWLDDAVVGQDAKGRTKVHADRIDPIGRLGGNEYVTFGEIVDIPRDA